MIQQEKCAIFDANSSGGKLWDFLGHFGEKDTADFDNYCFLFNNSIMLHIHRQLLPKPCDTFPVRESILHKIIIIESNLIFLGGILFKLTLPMLATIASLLESWGPEFHVKKF